MPEATRNEHLFFYTPALTGFYFRHLALSFPVLNADPNKWIFISATPALPKDYVFFSPHYSHRMIIGNVQSQTLLVFKE